MKNKEKFVIQRHSSDADVHWDFMLQKGGCLQTWRIDLPPEQIKGQAVKAERIFDHPLKFLTYEGPVKNNTGQVRIADLGNYDILDKNEKETLLQIDGQVLKGRFTFNHIEKDMWQLQRTID